jgi:hypothetical protein
MNGQQHGMVAPAPSAVKHPGADVGRPANTGFRRLADSVPQRLESFAQLSEPVFQVSPFILQVLSTQVQLEF